MKLWMALCGLLLATPVYAQGQQCAPRADALKFLGEKHGESRQSIGMAPNGLVMELFASIDAGTWTIIVTRPDGITCMVASGMGYENLSEPPVPQGDPA